MFTKVLNLGAKYKYFHLSFGILRFTTYLIAGCEKGSVSMQKAPAFIMSVLICTSSSISDVSVISVWSKCLLAFSLYLSSTYSLYIFESRCLIKLPTLDL